MQYTTLSLLALALGSSAIPNPKPHWRHRHHFSGFPSFSAGGSGVAAPTGIAAPSGVLPTGFAPTGVAPTGGVSILPVSTAAPSVTGINQYSSSDDDDDDDDDEEETTKTKSTKTKTTKTKSTKTAEATSSADDDEDATTSAAAEATSSSSDDGEAEETASASAVASESGASSAAAQTTAAPTGSSSSGGSSSGGGLPASSGTSALSAAQTIAAGESFDGGLIMYDRGVDCTGQAEGGDSDAVFMIENGGSLSNVIIGPNQIEGIHCEGACTLTNVWWSAVCEDAFTVKNQDAGETTTITGGGAFGAEDKVIQHNGAGTVSISGFTVDNFGKLYRSCGNCKTMYERHVILDDITATEGKILAGINSNYGDTATLTNIKASGVTDICVTFTGNDSGDEPEENGSGPSESCIYSESDVTSS